MLTSKDLTWSKDLLWAWSGAVVLRERAPGAKIETTVQSGFTSEHTQHWTGFFWVSTQVTYQAS